MCNGPGQINHKWTIMDKVVRQLDKELVDKFSVKSQIREDDHDNVTVGSSIHYIVAAVVIEDSSVLMIRESKSSCYGKWYLPAGKMQQDESIEDALKREVKEEAFLDVQPLSLLCIESESSDWFRFTFTAKSIGGTLKTPEQEDTESIEARWIPINDVYSGEVNLRMPDIIPLITKGEKWFQNEDRFKDHCVLPLQLPHRVCTVRVYLVTEQSSGLYTYLDHKSLERLRFVEKVISGNDLVTSSDVGFIQSILFDCGYRGSFARFTHHGVLSLEHTGGRSSVEDGFKLCLLAEIKDNLATKELKNEWMLLENKALVGMIKKAICEGLCPPHN